MVLTYCGLLASHKNCLEMRIWPFENVSRRQQKNPEERGFDIDDRRPRCVAESHKCVPQNSRGTTSLTCHTMPCPFAAWGRDILEKNSSVACLHACARYTGVVTSCLYK